MSTATASEPIPSADRNYGLRTSTSAYLPPPSTSFGPHVPHHGAIPSTMTSTPTFSHHPPVSSKKYFQEPFYRTSLKRVGWLGIFMCSLSTTAVIMNSFEHILAKQIELAYFVPLLAGHGGNTGGQSVGTVLSALSSGDVQPTDAPKVICKEVLSGILSGALLGAVVSPIAYKVLGISFPVATVLFVTMLVVSTIASTLGALIPFVCIFLGLDPSVVAAPAMTSFVDVCGLMSYFLVASTLFKWFGLEL